MDCRDDEIYNIEYVHRLPAISALPVKLAGLDGIPARVLAIEDSDLPRELGVTA